jgi:hypothetical protein
VVECQYEQKFSNDKNVLCEPDKDHEDLAKKNMEDPIISNKSSGDIMEDFFCVSLNIIVEVLEDMDDELKFEVKKYRNKLQLNFIGIESKTSNMHFFLLYTHH